MPRTVLERRAVGVCWIAVCGVLGSPLLSWTSPYLVAVLLMLVRLLANFVWLSSFLIGVSTCRVLLTAPGSLLAMVSPWLVRPLCLPLRPSFSHRGHSITILPLVGLRITWLEILPASHIRSAYGSWLGVFWTPPAAEAFHFFARPSWQLHIRSFHLWFFFHFPKGPSPTIR